MAYVMKNRKPLLTDDEAAFVLENYLSMSFPKIGEKLGKSGKQIEGWVRNHISDRIKKHRQINDTYFSEIDTPEKAYWLGLIYADGWVCKYIRSKQDEKPRYNYEFGIELQRQDEYILYQLNDALGGENTIKQKTNELVIADNEHVTRSESSVLRVYSKQIVEDLLKHGIDYRKSHSSVFPVVDLQYFPQYLRGYIDGDGCIHKNLRGNLAVHITCSNQDCLIYIQDVLNNAFGISSSVYCEHNENYLDKYRLYCYRKNDAISLLNLIYRDPNTPRLDRKYKIYTNSNCLAA